MHKLAYFIKNKYINKLKAERLKLKAKTERRKTGVIFSLVEAVDGGRNAPQASPGVTRIQPFQG